MNDKARTPLEAATILSPHLWISPKDFLPNDMDETVLICCSGKPADNILYEHSYALASYSKDEGWITDEYPYWTPTVHFWMRIPKTPEGTNESV